MHGAFAPDVKLISLYVNWPVSLCYPPVDVTEVLCELELTIRRVKVSTAPDGKMMDLFFITDTRFVFKVSCYIVPKP